MSKRPSLTSFSPKPMPAPVAADGGRVEEAPAAAAAKGPGAGVKYPKVSVYLTPDEIRTIKLLGVENGQRVSDICAAAIREWLANNGHARGARFKA